MFNKRIIFALLLPFTPLLAHADDIAPMPPAAPSLLVGEMLVIDANRALAAEKAKSQAQGATTTVATVTAVAPSIANPSPTAGPTTQTLAEQTPASAPSAPAISLHAIYGVGKRLFADVRIDGHLVTYGSGRSEAVRNSGADIAWTLQSIRMPCITLADKSGKTLKSCIGGS